MLELHQFIWPDLAEQQQQCEFGYFWMPKMLPLKAQTVI